ncbi:hypothetical protein QJQ45_025047 [Haematococcus lacustris]|nr:hypothetical protein QJQ45_025047 [Haematococcus lacustris]
MSLSDSVFKSFATTPMSPMPGMPPLPSPPMPLYTSPAVPNRGLPDAVDIVEHPGAPGFGPEDVQVELVEHNTLVVSGKKVVDQVVTEVEGGVHVLRRQSSASSFHRSFVLPDNIQAEGIRAYIDQGVLTVDIPKALPGMSGRRRSITVERGQGQPGADMAPAGAPGIA